MIYGILLVYYEDRRRQALEKFFDIVGRLGDDFKVVVVNNAKLGIWVTDCKKFVEIGGDNRVREFSGWDRGIQYIKTNFVIQEDDIFIIANDTFCFHRNWHALKRNWFIDSVAKLRAQRCTGICGEVSTFGKSFELVGLRADNWVSTYLFGLTGSYVINSDFRLSLTENELSLMVQDIKNGQIIWRETVDANLQIHLQEWLFPPEGVAGWYSARVTNDEIKLQKLRAIINEKYLSAKCCNMGGCIIDVERPLWFKLLDNVRLFLKTKIS